MFFAARSNAGFQGLFGHTPNGVHTLSLSNNGDWVMLQDATGASLDVVAWEQSLPGWSGLNASGKDALVRTNPNVDTDAAADWSSAVAAPH